MPQLLQGCQPIKETSLTKPYHSAAEVEVAFYSAFRNLDTTRMQHVWANSPTAFCIHPSGQLFRGHESILASWTSIFQVAEKPQIQYTLINETKHEDLVVRLVAERIGSPASQAESSAVVLATNVYVLIDRGWRMLGHHASQTRSEPAGPRLKKKLH